jgi:hypothetical protein
MCQKSKLIAMVSDENVEILTDERKLQGKIAINGNSLEIYVNVHVIPPNKKRRQRFTTAVQLHCEALRHKLYSI